MIVLPSIVQPLAQTRIVVVLQSEYALWFKWRGDELLDTFAEPVRHDNLQHGVRCPWIATEHDSPQQLVELVIDTAIDELDKVRIAVGDTGVRCVQRWQLKRHLKRDYPEAKVYALPSYMAPDILSIHHQVVPDSGCDWLVRLQDSNVFITHVVTTLELFTGLTQSVAGPALYCLNAGREHRYVMIDEAAPLFMRTHRSEQGPAPMHVEEADNRHQVMMSSDNALVFEPAELADTLGYITDVVLPDHSSVSVMAPATTFASVSADLQSACTLAALCVNNSVEFTVWQCSEGRFLQATPLSVTARLPGRRQLAARLLHGWAERVPWPLPPIRSTSLNPNFRVAAFRPLADTVLKPSVNNSLLRQRINGLRNATVLCAAMATITVGFAAVHGIDSARHRAQLDGEDARLANKIVHLADAVKTLHPSPEYASRSLQRIQAYQSIKPLDPHILLGTVATAITDFPALVLETLSWSVVSDEAFSDDPLVVHANMASRERLWTIDSGHTQIHIELSGAVLSEQGLRDQQSALRSFVAYLQAVPGISSVNVLESPAQAARSSEVLVESGARYRLSLLLGTS